MKTTQEEELFTSIGQGLEDSELSQMFGKPCFKIKGKAFFCFFQNEMVFKLIGENYKEAISLNGSQLFDPSGKKRPMKEWVQIPFLHNDLWNTMAIEARKYVSEKINASR